MELDQLSWPVFFLDVEASGLSDDSYPIEVGWISMQGDSCDTFLIMPDEDWIYWDDLAEETVHGISRDLLANKGLSVQHCARRLNQRLQGGKVCVDALEWDGFWLDRLFVTAGIEQAFELVSINSLFPDYSQAIDVNPVHRALADAVMTRTRVLESKIIDQT